VSPGVPMIVIKQLFNDQAAGLRRKVVAIYSLLLLGNLLAWAWALLAFRSSPILLGTAALAYSFGLRHAFDADHIAAIDNVTRKMMQEGKRPIAAGFFFSLGHSTVVVGLSVVIALAAMTLTDSSGLRDYGALIGTGISALFLFAIAIANMVVLAQIYRAFQRVKRGGPLSEQDLDMVLARRGFLGRIFRGVFRMIERSWHMYPLGILFGLGFDTASEVGLLGISASQASQGISILSLLIFPALFTAGMSLLDTTDGVLMLGAYGWAFFKPVRKLYYNMTITFVSVVAALAIGGVEALGLIGEGLSLRGGFWDSVGNVNDSFGVLGFVIVGLFMLSWLISFIIYRIKGYDRIEVTT
jgi:nickel/cobalt transporter (NiCoT) family protein